MSGFFAVRPLSQAQLDRFRRLAAEWKKQSRFMSNTAQMAMSPSYQRIIGMGWNALPLILEELKNEPDHWFWALQSITGENPVAREIAGQLKETTEAWLMWGKLHGFVQ